MNKKYKVLVTQEAYFEVNVEEDTTDDELLDKIEEEMKKGYVCNTTYFEIEGEMDDNE